MTLTAKFLQIIIALFLGALITAFIIWSTKLIIFLKQKLNHRKNLTQVYWLQTKFKRNKEQNNA